MRPIDQISEMAQGRGHHIITPLIKRRPFSTATVEHAKRHWVKSDPFASAFFNCLSAVFPCGESFMIRSLRPVQSMVPEPLKGQIRGFIEQEAGHSREHVAMNKVLIDAGYDISLLERAIRKFVGTFRFRSTSTKVAATMCIEHITAIVAAEVLKNTAHLDDSDPALRKLWLWHAIEEVEHKAVAFDAWMYLTRDWTKFSRWALRSLLMLTISVTFVFNRTRGQLVLLSQDGYGFWQSMAGIFKFGFGKGGIGRNILRTWAHFFKPGFHPWDIDDRELIAKGETLLATPVRTYRKPVKRPGKTPIATAA